VKLNQLIKDLIDIGAGIILLGIIALVVMAVATIVYNIWDSTLGRYSHIDRDTVAVVTAISMVGMQIRNSDLWGKGL
jgi:uncharacterized membrane protein YjgN (DUF898 family)